ncbi:unnamed protein product [Triticum turgidum subsp. durum]|uniref:Uncharacterized protein n=1 Tax=Triticum turgidum subsp. durum TaxID=4567 RepID=A0A9R0YZ82_TRITD|nr:unnamed protein product [Triticum turgidum subsp. durum]
MQGMIQIQARCDLNLVDFCPPIGGCALSRARCGMIRISGAGWYRYIPAGHPFCSDKTQTRMLTSERDPLVQLGEFLGASTFIEEATSQPDVSIGLSTWLIICYKRIDDDQNLHR